jgi:Family of unknown function (DUF5330)
MRIFRTLFLLTAGVLLIPSPPDDGSRLAGQQASTPQMLGAALSAVADVKGFCGRQPGVCDTAGIVAATLEGKAKHGVKLLYEWANGGAEGGVDDIQTGSTSKADGSSSAVPKQSTLTLQDLIPEWRGPKPRRS